MYRRLLLTAGWTVLFSRFVFAQEWQVKYNEILNDYQAGNDSATLDKALPCLDLAVKEYGKNSKPYVYTLKLVTNSCYDLGRYLEGIRYGKEETSLIGTVTDTSGIDFANSYHTLGLNYQGAGKFDSSLYCLLKTENIFRNEDPANRSEDYANVLSEIGSDFLGMEQYAQAGNYLEQSLLVYTSLESVQEKYLYTLLNAGNLYLKIKNYDEALKRSDLLVRTLEDQGLKGEPVYGEALLTNAEANKGLQNVPQAEKKYAAYLLVLNAGGRKDTPEYNYALKELGGLYRNEGKIQSYDSLLAANKNVQTGQGSGLTDYLNLAVLYQNKREFEKASQSYKNAFDLLKSGAAHEPFDEGLLYENYALMYYSLGKYSEADANSGKSVNLFRNANIGPEYLASGLNTRGLILKAEGLYDSAGVCLNEAAGLSSVPAMKNIDLNARILENLSSLKMETGNNPEAENYIRQALEIRKGLNGENSLSYINTLNSYGAVLDLSGDFTRSIQVLSHAYELLNAQENADQELSTRILTNLGTIYLNTGNGEMADSLFTVSAMKSYRIFGENSTETARSQVNLARSKQATGNYRDAENNFRQALKIFESVAGRDNKNFAECANSFGVFYQVMGNYEEAERIYKENLNGLTEQNPLYAVTIQNLATLYQLEEKYTLAEPLLTRAVRLDSIQKGADHPDFAVSLQNLASLYQKTGRPGQAEPLYRKALGIDAKIYGKNHPSYAKKLFNLATLYQDEGRYNDALPLMKESVDIRKAVFGENHPDYAYGMFGLAVINDALGNDPEARTDYETALAIYRRQLRDIFPALSEKEKTAFYNKLRPVIEDYRDFAVEYSGSDPSIISDLYNLQLETKAILLNASARVRSRILGSGNSALIGRYNQWITLKEQIVKSYNYTRDELAKQGIDIDQVQRQANDIEKELSESSEEFAGGLDKSATSWKEIQAALSPGEAALEIIRIRKNIRNDSVIYAVLMVKPGLADHPDLVILPEGITMEIREYSRYINSILFRVPNDISYGVYWKPLEEKLKGVKTVYISADGIYNKININTLFNPFDRKFVLDEHEIILLSSTRDLLGKPALSATRNPAELMGFPDYKLGLTADSMGNDLPQSTRDISELFHKGIHPLPGTKEEVDSIQRILESNHWPVSLFTGRDATEYNLKSVKSPGILHLATHGFFLKDVSIDKNLNENEQLIQNARISNPLLRSGILLAGAEAGIRSTPGRQAGSVDSDGILTAFEAMNLDLDHTRLVVLSACETGLGELKNGEGIYGLQRSFLIAGASNLVMSLWKVNDETTQKLMTLFYTDWLNGRKLTDAFRDTQIQLKNAYPDPYFWGAFIMVGR